MGVFFSERFCEVKQKTKAKLQKKMGNSIAKLIISKAKGDAQRISNEAALITPDNFQAISNQKHRLRNSICDKFTRWLLTPSSSSETIIQDYQTYMPCLDARNLSFALSNIGINAYISMLTFLGLNKTFDSDAQMESVLTQWMPNIKQEDQDSLLSFHGMEQFLSTSWDPFDLLERKGDYFEINTEFMNRYEHKPNMCLLGGIMKLRLTQDGFKIVSLTYQGITYVNNIYEDASEAAVFALHAFYGSISLHRTYCTHATGLHYLASAKIGLATQSHLREDDPVRQVLKPTEFMAKNGIARAIKSLFGKDGFFLKLGPFTYQGLRNMVRDYITQHSGLHAELDLMAPDGIKNRWNLTQEECNSLPFVGFITWSNHIRFYMQQVVENSLFDHNRWIKSIFGDYAFDDKELATRMISYMYFTQVKHSYMSSTELFYQFSRFSYILRRGKKHQNSHDLRYIQLMKIIVDVSTSEKWVPLNLNLSNLIASRECRSIMSQFYTATKTLKIDQRLKLAQPIVITISTGL